MAESITFWAKIFFLSVGIFLTGGLIWLKLFGEKAKWSREEYCKELEKVLKGMLILHERSNRKKKIHMDFTYNGCTFEYDNWYATSINIPGPVHPMERIKTKLNVNYYFRLSGKDVVENTFDSIKNNLKKDYIDVNMLPIEFKNYKISSNNIEKSIKLISNEKARSILLNYITKHNIIGDTLELGIGSDGKDYVISLDIQNLKYKTDFKPDYVEIYNNPALILIHVKNIFEIKKILEAK